MTIEEKYQPILDRVLILPTPPDQVVGGWALIESEQQKKYEGTVVAVGTGIPLHNVKLDISGDATPEVLDRVERLITLLKEGRQLSVKPGDYVLFGQYAGTKVKIDGKDYIMVRELDIFSIIKNG